MGKCPAQGGFSLLGTIPTPQGMASSGCAFTADRSRARDPVQAGPVPYHVSDFCVGTRKNVNQSFGGGHCSI